MPSLRSDIDEHIFKKYSALPHTAVKLEQKFRTQMQERRCNDTLYFLIQFLLKQSDKSTGYGTIESRGQVTKHNIKERTKDAPAEAKKYLH